MIPYNKMKNGKKNIMKRMTTPKRILFLQENRNVLENNQIHNLHVFSNMHAVYATHVTRYALCLIFTKLSNKV